MDFLEIIKWNSVLDRVGRFFFFILIALVCLNESRPQPLRVMSFNIRYDEPRDGVNAWANRKQHAADVIRFHKADTVGLQEALASQLNDLKSALKVFGSCGVGRTDGKEEGEFSAIIYNTERLKLRDCNTFWLSSTPDVPGSKGWDAAYPRVVTWARFTDQRSGRTFFHFNTHFDHMGKTARIESAKLLLAKIKSIAGEKPFVLTGDLNFTEDAEAYGVLTQKGSENPLLADARYISRNGHFGPTSTFSGFKQLEPGRKIDHIFVSRGTDVAEHAVLADQWDGLWASDHLPVLAEINWK